MNKYDGFTNSQISKAIDECIHSQRDRDILKDRFIDGLTFEAIGELRELSVRHVKNIVYRSSDKLFRYLKG